MANNEIEPVGVRVGNDGPIARPLVDMADRSSAEILRTSNTLTNLENPSVLHDGFLTFDNIYTQSDVAPAVTAAATQATDRALTTTTTAAQDPDIPTEPIGVPLTGDQPTISQSTVQLQTPMISMTANGGFEKADELGTGFYTQAPNGETVLVTDAHVVAAGDTIDGQFSHAVGPTQVLGPDGTVTTATLAGYNQNTDLAALTVNGPLLPPQTLNVNPNANLSQGDNITTVGYPWGQSQPGAVSTSYEGTVPMSNGFLNENGRNMIVGEGFGAPGLSGSAALNSDNQVVGVLDKGYNNETFYTPADQVQSFLNQLYPAPLSQDYLKNALGTTISPETSGTIAVPEVSTPAAPTTPAPVEAPAAAPVVVPPVESSVTVPPVVGADQTAAASAVTAQDLAASESASVQAAVSQVTQDASAGAAAGDSAASAASALSSANLVDNLNLGDLSADVGAAEGVMSYMEALG